MDALVDLIGPADAPLTLRGLFAGGDPGPIVGALAQVPELCEPTLPFIGAALGPSAVSFRHKEIAILRTSANLSCRYCVDAHTVVAFESGLTDTEVRALRGELVDGSLTDVFTDPVEQALIAWIDEVSTGRGAVDPTTAATARDRLGDHRLVELTTTVGCTIFLNRFATGLSLPTSEDTLKRLADLGFQTLYPDPDPEPEAATPVALIRRNS